VSNRAALILGIETSCDETAAAIVDGERRVRSNVIASQHDLHARYSGVVPEIASRAHVEKIQPVIEEALRVAGAKREDLRAVAVGYCPGLIGSLLVGVTAAKAMAWSLGIPLIGVDHVRAHLYAGLLDAPTVAYPALGLVVSGGHTQIDLVNDDFVALEPIGRTIDDALGEAYDKAATMLGLPYPGGPNLDRLAQSGRDDAEEFPLSLPERDNFDFSFSGLKTALLYKVRGHPVGRGASSRFERDHTALSESRRADLAASFQRCAVHAVIRKLGLVLDRNSSVRTLLVGGGVSANSRLRTELTRLAAERSLDLRLPSLEYCLDNAAMIAGFAHTRFRRGERDDLTLQARASAARLR